MTGRERPLVVVMVGTDHHPFDRLMDWIEKWIAGRRGDVRCVVQHGSSRPPAGAECYDLIPHHELQKLLRDADAVVCQGGPGGITEARLAGRLPITVPRTARLGEHVDDHQVRFTRVLAEHGRIALVTSAEELAQHLDAALADPRRYAVAEDGGDADATAVRIGELIDELVRGKRRRFRWKAG